MNFFDKNRPSLPRAIAVDFDGCLCADSYPEIGHPHKRVLSKLRIAQSQGTRLILWTCREGELLDAAIKWCKEQGICFDAINDNLPERIAAFGGSNPRKIFADEYWDDRAWRIDG